MLPEAPPTRQHAYCRLRLSLSVTIYAQSRPQSRFRNAFRLYVCRRKRHNVQVIRLSALMDTPSQQNLNQLPIGSTLGDFTITGIVGEGGFGIVYLAYEAALDRVVAIKEYLPSAIAGRTGNQSVMVRSQLNNNAFASGLKNFMREAQMLAKFSHPALVEVHRVWEQNSTAYMAMRYYEGKTLREWRLTNEDFDEARIRRLLEPVMDALSLLHAQNVLHRDVSPDNILMRGSGAPVLLDLGAARLVIGGMTQALTTILKPGYAPIEQYVDDGTMHQGPWTDVYGLGAVLYYMLTGVAPPQAVARMITDPIRNMTSKVRVSVSPALIEAVIAALAVRPENRYQSVDELRDALGWTEPLPAEPRTQYARTEIAGRNAASTTAGAASTAAGAVSTASVAASVPATAPSQPLATAFVRSAQQVPVPSPTPPAVSVNTPPMTVSIPPIATSDAGRVTPVAEDDDKTVIWNASAVAAAARKTADENSRSLAKAPDRAKPKAEPRSVSPSASATPAVPIAAARAASYGDTAATSGGGKTKTWLFVGLAAAVAAVGGYFAMNRGAAPTSVAASTSPTTTTQTPADTAAPTGLIVAQAAPTVAVAVPAPSPVAPPSGAATPVTAPVKSAPTPAPASPAPAIAAPATQPVADGKEAARREEEEKLAKAKREAQEKAKADALEKAAKTKADNDERIRKQKQETEDRAAAARAEQDEKARRAREEEDRLATAKAKQEADRQKAASAPTTGGLVVTPPRRNVDELSAAGNAAFKRGELSAARAAWNELVSHPEATARSKAIAFNNLAVSYCQNGDEANCERMYASMLRADRAYGSEISEREMPQFKRAYDRAARNARVPGY